MRLRSVALAALVVACAGALVVAARSTPRADTFVVHRLVADVPGRAAHVDPQLVNPWGLAATATGEWWTGNEARESSTLYTGSGRKTVLDVRVEGGPTAVVFNSGHGFVEGGGGRSDPTRFIYAGEDGVLRAWTPTLPTGWSTRAVPVFQGAPAALYRGLALLGARLYVTDFHNGRVVVLDARWREVQLAHGAFTDPSIPAWYAPFGIEAIGGHVFVTYAWRAPVNGNDSPSGGYVDEFTAAGRLVSRLPR